MKLKLNTWHLHSGRDAQSLAAQIQRSNFWLAMLLVVCLGGSMLALSVNEVTKTQSKANHAAVNVIGQILSAEVKNRINSVTDLASNPITWTSLTDSEERNNYLKPALDALEKGLASSAIALFDHQGQHLAGTKPDPSERSHIDAMAVAVLAHQQRQMVLLPGAQVKLLVAEPVMHPQTQNVMGILTGVIDLNGLFLQHVQQAELDVGIEIRHGGQVVATTTALPHKTYLPASFDLPFVLNGPTSNMANAANMAIVLYSTQNPWSLPVAWLLGWAALIGLLLTAVVWRVSRQLAMRITARIERLADECESIGAGRATQVAPDTHQDEIGVLSRTLAKALAAYHHINQNLELVVEQKTNSLFESEGRFRGFFENNATVMLQIAPHTGQVLLANQAAADFYGYSLGELMAMNIANINCLPPAQTRAEVALVEHQNRKSSNFQHQLQSGEVRDVEVYSTPMQINDVAGLFSVVHDVTERVSAGRKLKISNQALMAISQGVLVTDAQGRIISMNNAFFDITGYCLEEVLGTECKFLQGPGTDAQTIQTIREAKLAGRDFDGEILNYRKNGHVFWNALTITPMFDDHGVLRHFIGIIRDITERRQAKERLQLAANVFTFSREGIMITLANGAIVETNKAFAFITGYSQEEVVGKTPHMLGSGRQDSQFFPALWAQLKSQGHWQGEIWNRRKTGEFYAAMLNISAVHNSQNKDKVDYFVALYTDITAKKNYEQQLVRSAHYDALTGLANRVLFADRLNQAMAQALRHQKLLALIYLDLDGFKAVNDAHGHSAGDILLMTVAKRMQQCLREGDTLARVGGDEFVAVLVDLESPGEGLPVMERMLLAASQPVSIDGAVVVQVSASLGATYFPQAGEMEAEQLIEQADQTMYDAKQSGKNRIHVFDSQTNQLVAL